MADNRIPTASMKLQRQLASDFKLREEISANRLIARKLGKRTLINVEDLNTWAASLPRVGSARLPQKAA
jgi:hypothetical protein